MPTVCWHHSHSNSPTKRLPKWHLKIIKLESDRTFLKKFQLDANSMLKPIPLEWSNRTLTKMAAQNNQIRVRSHFSEKSFSLMPTVCWNESHLNSPTER